MEWFPDCRDGGLDRYYYEELESFAQSGIEGTALISSGAELQLQGISVRPMATKGARLVTRWHGARTIARAAFLTGVDVVNAHFALYAFPYLREIPKAVPLVVNFQGPWAEEIRLQRPGFEGRCAATVAKQIERVVYRRADHVITLSQAFRQLLHRIYGVPLDRITVVPGALHLGRYLQTPARDEARRILGWPTDRPIFISVRRLAKRMGLDLLLSAIAEVRRSFPNVLLLIGGKGPEEKRLKIRVAELELEQNVRMLGFIPEVELPTCYAAADCSIVPTVALEGFGLITAESLACGTPVLGSPVGATPEILKPLDPNCVFDAATPEAMARRISAVLRGDIRLPNSEACRAYVERYGWTMVIPKVLAVFSKAIEERRALAHR